jgi:hypothetical protein
MNITKLIRQRQQAFYAYDAARETAFVAANERDALKKTLAAADRAIQNFLRSKLPS